jgi:beta-lactamase regulating signal transducer with metallopeptidase domain
MENTILTRLLEITVYSAAILIAVVLFRSILGKWLSPSLKYMLWFLVVLRLIVPATFESGFHFITLPQEETTVSVSADTSVVTGEPVVQSEPVLDGGTVTAAEQPSGTNAAPSVSPAATATKTHTLSWREWLIVVWAAGCALILFIHAALNLRLNRRIRRIGCAPGEKTEQLYQKVKNSMNIRARVPISLMPDIKSPALTVQFRPKLLLPDRLLYRADQEHMAFAMAHELMHFKRRDYLVCLLIVFLRAVYWFNPVVWIMPRLLRMDMESACDARVVQSMDKAQKLNYVNLLLALGEEDDIDCLPIQGGLCNETIVDG